MRRCLSCKETKSNSEFSRSLRAKSGLQTYCKPCSLIKSKANKKSAKARYDRYYAKYPTRFAWRGLRRRAKRDGLTLLSLERFEAWMKEQPQHCAYCGMDAATAKDRFGHTLHVDRKECQLGYAEGNISLACHRCNVVKSAYLSHDQMMEVAGMFFGGANSHASLKERLEFAEFEWNRATEGMQERDAMIASLKARIAELEGALNAILAIDSHGYCVAPMGLALRRRAEAALKTRHGEVPDLAYAKCDCAVMCQDLGIQGGCRYIKPSRTMLRKLVDLTWNHVTESQEVPSTNLADELIDRASSMSSTKPQPRPVNCAWGKCTYPDCTCAVPSTGGGPAA